MAQGKRSQLDLMAVMRRYSGVEQPSIGQVAREFDIPESTLRGLIQRYDFPRDNLLREFEVLRGYARRFLELIDEVEGFVVVEREYRARTASPAESE